MIKDIILKVKENNGKFRPKCNQKKFLYNLVLDLCVLCVAGILIFEILKAPNSDTQNLVLSIVLLVILEYMMLISPYQQYPEKYRISFENEDTLSGFRLFYKKKEVKISYELDENGKISFEEGSLLKNISYADGSVMLNLTKLRVINYFKGWLENNDLIA